MTTPLGGISKLDGVHPDIVRVVLRAHTITPGAFTIGEGLRTVARQRQLVAAGASKTMDSRHIQGLAVDLWALVGGKVRWDWNLYIQIALTMRKAAALEKVSIEWGGTWKSLASGTTPLSSSFPDGPHYQLPKRTHPNGTKYTPAPVVWMLPDGAFVHVRGAGLRPKLLNGQTLAALQAKGPVLLIAHAAVPYDR